jgi:hypothetical protein
LKTPWRAAGILIAVLESVVAAAQSKYSVADGLRPRVDCGATVGIINGGAGEWYEEEKAEGDEEKGLGKGRNCGSHLCGTHLDVTPTSLQRRGGGRWKRKGGENDVCPRRSYQPDELV